MNKYICECCGGQINPYTMKCEYCGTQYKNEDEKVFRIETFQSKVQTFKSVYNLPDEYLVRHPKEASEIAIHHVANQLADIIAPYCEYMVEDDPMCRQKRICARIKIVEPINKGLNIEDE
jgi:hypothetical protein